MDKIKKDLYDYCKRNIEDFELKEQLALSVMDTCRCSFQSASPLADEMQECINDYCADNELCEEDYTADEVLFYECE